MPLPVLTNVLNQLANSGLVISAMGVTGGYALARAADEISLADMIEAIEGNFKLTLCCSDESEDDLGTCDLQDGCRVVEPLRRVHACLKEFLDSVTLAEIAFYSVPISLNVETSGLRSDDSPAEAVG